MRCMCPHTMSQVLLRRVGSTAYYKILHSDPQVEDGTVALAGLMCRNIFFLQCRTLGGN